MGLTVDEITPFKSKSKPNFIKSRLWFESRQGVLGMNEPIVHNI